ncbi:uncharacterized protein DFL_005648 [Arthrobotrys flagrans]|uniref:Uncharacterized protein n=1 Tax=Arthrobotrys flagrans TaxID=97331 RepID=A0A436ZY43_ARTFL|nr:hypothetical protein DFL_005648 [Arthrobotrys flagrans]
MIIIWKLLIKYVAGILINFFFFPIYKLCNHYPPRLFNPNDISLYMQVYYLPNSCRSIHQVLLNLTLRF